MSIRTLTPASFCVLAMLLTGCITNIKAQDDTIQPSKVPLGSFEEVLLKPLDASQATELDHDAAQRINQVLSECMSAALPRTRLFESAALDGDGSILVIEPKIVEAKKVTVGQRIFFGALAGSSAALMRVTFTNGRTHQILADPTFYAKANAMGGAWTFGATDNSMLTRLPQTACDYVRANS